MAYVSDSIIEFSKDPMTMSKMTNITKLATSGYVDTGKFQHALLNLKRAHLTNGFESHPHLSTSLTHNSISVIVAVGQALAVSK